MASFDSIPKDVLRLILRRLSLADIGSLGCTCRALRDTPYLITSLDLPAGLLAVKTNHIQIYAPRYACMSGCAFAGTEANFGYCSSCVRKNTHPGIREQSRAVWLAQKKKEDERVAKVPDLCAS